MRLRRVELLPLFLGEGVAVDDGVAAFVAGEEVELGLLGVEGQGHDHSWKRVC